MICPDCRGRGFTPNLSAFDNDEAPMMGPCETCDGSGILADDDCPYSEAEIERSQRRIALVLGELPDEDD